MAQKSSHKVPGLLIVLGTAGLYWIYLFLTARPSIVFDSVGYLELGHILKDHGWAGYFAGGPHREPLYPLFLSWALMISEKCSWEFLKVLIGAQLMVMGVSVWLLIRLIRPLKLIKPVYYGSILYFCFSPAIVNSALSVYSEVLTYPIILMLSLITVTVFEKCTSKTSAVTLAASGIALGLTLFLATMVKAVFEIAGVLFIVFIVFKIGSGVRPPASGRRTFYRPLGVFLLAALISFLGPLHLYKAANLKSNGQYVVTNRGGWALYGNTARRTQNLSSRQWLAAIAFVPGKGVCERLFSKNECRFWSFETSDGFGLGKLADLDRQKLGAAAANASLIRDAASMALHQPVQYACLTFLEGMKMLFWETTQLGFVQYPAWLSKIFDWPPLQNGLRLGMFLLTVFGCLFGMANGRKKAGADESHFTYAALSLIAAVILPYSFFFILTRYALPLAPLYLMLIAAALNDVIKTSRR